MKLYKQYSLKHPISFSFPTSAQSAFLPDRIFHPIPICHPLYPWPSPSNSSTLGYSSPLHSLKQLPSLYPVWTLSTSTPGQSKCSIYSASLSKLPDTKADNWDDWCDYWFMGLHFCWAPVGLFCLVFTSMLFRFPFSNLSWCLWISDTVGDNKTIEAHCLDFLLLPSLLKSIHLYLPWLPESDLVLPSHGQ